MHTADWCPSILHNKMKDKTTERLLGSGGF
jgi:hypothetical protein